MYALVPSTCSNIWYKDMPIKQYCYYMTNGLVPLRWVPHSLTLVKHPLTSLDAFIVIRKELWLLNQGQGRQPLC